MKAFLIYDIPLDQQDFNRLLHELHVNSIEIFPLVEDWRIQEQNIETLKQNQNASFEEIDSASLIADQTKILRDFIGNWSCKISNLIVNKKNVKEWFLLKKERVSMWWLSLFSERNTMKTDSFLNIAQTLAIQNLMKQGMYDVCFIAINNKKLRAAIKNLTVTYKVKLFVLQQTKTKYNHHSCKQIIFQIIKNNQLLLTFAISVQYLWRKICSRLLLGKQSCLKKNNPDLLVVSYFPSLDKEMAEKGVFQNKYMYNLQQKFQKMNREVIWLLMSVKLNDDGYLSSIRIAKKLGGHDKHIYMLEEFLRIKDFVLAFGLWCKHVLISIFLYQKIRRELFNNHLITREYEPIVRNLWTESFVGSSALESLFMVMIFRHAFRSIKGIEDCVYYAEMHAWEKALNAAKKNISPQVKTVGYQHSIFSSNLFSYCAVSGETIQLGLDTDMPLPDVLAANGQLPYELLQKSNYTGLKILEAVRYLDLNKKMAISSKKSEKKPVLLIVGTGGKEEPNISLLSFIYRALLKSETYDIYFKPHPSTNLDEVLRVFNSNKLWIRKVENEFSIEMYLQSAWAVIVTSSAVAVEALAYGCEVIVPLLPDSILINAVVEFGGPCHVVKSPKALRDVWSEIVQKGANGNEDRKKDFIKRCWDLNEEMPRWETVLSFSKKHDINGEKVL